MRCCGRICIVQIQPRKHVSDHADIRLPPGNMRQIIRIIQIIQLRNVSICPLADLGHELQWEQIIQIIQIISLRCSITWNQSGRFRQYKILPDTCFSPGTNITTAATKYLPYYITLKVALDAVQDTSSAPRNGRFHVKKQENSNFYFGFPFHSFHGPDRLSVRSIPPKVHDLDLAGRADRYIPDLYDLYDLYDLARVARWEPYNLQDLGQVS